MIQLLRDLTLLPSIARRAAEIERYRRWAVTPEGQACRRQETLAFLKGLKTASGKSVHQSTSSDEALASTPRKAHPFASFRPAYWRGLTGYDSVSGTAGLSFNTFDGEIIRLQLDLHNLEVVHDVIGELLAHRPGTKVHAVRSSDKPSRSVAA